MVEQKYVDYWKAQLGKKELPHQATEPNQATEQNQAAKQNPVVKQKHIDYWRARMAESDLQCRAMEQEAWCQVKQAVALLKEQFGATKAIVFGSLVRNRFGEDSDIDLAVAGIKKTDFFQALSAVNDHNQRWIDLKPLEDLEPHFRERVLATGKVIDENS